MRCVCKSVLTRNKVSQEVSGMTDRPIVSIVMPCYNDGQYIQQAVDNARDALDELGLDVQDNTGRTAAGG